MPRFTISKDGETIQSIQLDGERIELGSANTCSLFIDDLLISLKQAVFIKTADGYDVEPAAKTPTFTMNGTLVEGRTKVDSGAVIKVECYEVRVDLDHPVAASAASSLADRQPAASPAGPSPMVAQEELPPLPEPLKLDELSPVAPEPPPPQPAPVSPAPMSLDEEQKTVFVAAPVGELVAVAGPLQGKSWPLRPGKIGIGRSTENQIVIRSDTQGQPDRSISRRHAWIHVNDDGIFVEDRNSTAGTFLNGRQLTAGQKVPLKRGDQVEIRSSMESTVLRVDLSEKQVPPPPVSPPRREPAVAPPPPVFPPRQEPVAPPSPPPRPQPRYEPPPPPPRETGQDISERRRRRERPRPAVDNPFEPGSGEGFFNGIPRWVWFVAPAALLIVIVLLVLLFK